MADESDVREICLSLPETSEGTWYGTAGYKVKGKGFVRSRPDIGDVVVVYVADVGEKEALISEAPEKFFSSPHYDGSSALLINLDAIDAAELRELLTDSWLLRAPAKVVARHRDAVLADIAERRRAAGSG